MPFDPISSIIGTAIGCIATAAFTSHREKRNRLRAFRESISGISAKLSDSPSGQLTEIYSAHREAVLVLCAAIRCNGIYAGVIQKFDAARDAFLRFLDTEKEHAFKQMFQGDLTDAPTPYAIQDRKQRMIAPLDILIECAH